jgi:glycosyltransferase involved in cell wall biosynthesis
VLIAIVQNVSSTDHRMVHTHNIAKELTSRGHQVDVIIQKSMARLNDKLPYNIIEISGETYSILGQARFCYKLRKLLQNKKYQIIHAKNPFSSILPAFSIRSEPKIIYDIRGLWIDFGATAGYIPGFLVPFLNQIDKLCMQKSDAVIAISNELKKILIQRGVKESKIKVIVGDGVDVVTQRKQKNIRDILGIDGKVVGYVGTISRTRFSDKIIEAFELVKEQYRGKISLAMIGPFSSNEQQYFKTIVRQKKLDDSILFTGMIPHNEVLSYYSSFDVAIAYHETNLPIYNVAVPTKILEYLAAGCRIVTTNQKMYINLLTHCHDAYLTNQNVSAFARGILRILDDKDLSLKLTTNSIITAKKYSIEHIVNEIHNVYETIII